MQVKVSDVIFDKKTYPRSGVNQSTAELYAEAMQNGAVFPPIEVQAVVNYPDKDKPVWLLVDGAHRLTAKQLQKAEEIDVVEWKPGTVIDYAKEWQSLILECAQRNISHGDRLSNKDKEKVARQIAESDPKKVWTEEMMADKLGVARTTINNWVKDIRAKQSASRDAIVTKLLRLGWAQQSIADLLAISQKTVSNVSNNVKFDNITNLIGQGRDMNYIAQHHNIDVPLAWGIRMDNKEDHPRFEDLEWGLRTWDYWNWNDCDERFGDDWPGRIPAQLVAHTLYSFTKQQDMVFDPMAGGGVTPDTCLAFNRRCMAFDLSTRDSRPEIQSHYWKVGSMDWPSVKTPDLIFFDPPYFSKMDDDYKEKATEATPPISSLPRDEYLAFFSEFFSLANANTKQGARFAFLNADWRDFQKKQAIDEDPANSITIFDYYRLLTDAGWTVTHRIECPMSSQRMGGNTVQSMQNNRTLGTVNRTLLVAKKG